MQHSIQKQQGATLFVALIILVVVTLIGVTAMKNANVEEQMASNLYQKNLTFQASESAVESTINDPTNNLIKLALNSNIPVEQEVQIPIPNTTATVSYASVGSGLAVGSSANLFSGMRLMITATGQIADLNAKTVTVHGIVRLAPGGG